MMPSSFFKHSLSIVGVAAVVGMTSFIGGNSAYAATIDTAPSWDGSTSVRPWGVPNTSTYGQTFTVTGSNNVLQSFSFQIAQASTPIPFAAYVAEWAGGRNGNIVGSLLYNSGQKLFSNVSSGFQQLTINTGGIQLNTGSKYVAFLSTSGLQAGSPSSTTSFGNVFNGQAYADGEFVFYNTGDNFAPLLNSNWETFADFGDLAFQANLTGATAVPTPALLPGLIGLGVSVLRKRKAEAVKQTSEV